MVTQMSLEGYCSSFPGVSPFVRLVVGNGERIRFWEDLWWGNQTLCSQFADLYRVISVKNLTVSNVLGNSLPLSWNFNFRRNLTDSEIDLLQRLMSSLILFFSLLHQIQERGLCLRQVFSVKSFFLALSKVSNPLMFLPAKFLWSSKVPSKVKALAWLVAHGKVVQSSRLVWVPPRSLEDMLKRNNRIFEDKGRTEEMVWDLIRFYSSLWASCTEAFRGVPLTFYNSIGLGFAFQSLKIDGVKEGNASELGIGGVIRDRHVCLSVSQGVIWILEPEKVPTFPQIGKIQRDAKKKKEILEVFPMRKYARIKDRSLILTESDGSYTAIPLKGCTIVAVSATDLPSKKW
ncbi:hypothetical protein CK203_095969 [Vitis vinifera]|uniref:SMP domain-containing protein n=1 Tax=Vitis vinifera TaxID=29760 RepID=A0A438CRV3_VITVI|nr:hypothetical protein CK203_095969 [Vitis vinifera]